LPTSVVRSLGIPLGFDPQTNNLVNHALQLLFVGEVRADERRSRAERPLREQLRERRGLPVDLERIQEKPGQLGWRLSVTYFWLRRALARLTPVNIVRSRTSKQESYPGKRLKKDVLPL
jgi:hypothetical protein